jgi:hypothetical protein
MYGRSPHGNVNTGQIAMTGQPSHHEPGQYQYHYNSPVVVHPDRTEDPDDFTIKEAMIPGLMMVIAALINIICLIVLFVKYTLVDEAQTLEMILAIIFYGIVGIPGTIVAIRSFRRAVIGIIIMASITLMVSGYQVR